MILNMSGATFPIKLTAETDLSVTKMTRTVMKQQPRNPTTLNVLPRQDILPTLKIVSNITIVSMEYQKSTRYVHMTKVSLQMI